MEDKLVDVLHNTHPVLEWYKKLQIVPMIIKELVNFQIRWIIFAT